MKERGGKEFSLRDLAEDAMELEKPMRKNADGRTGSMCVLEATFAFGNDESRVKVKFQEGEGGWQSEFVREILNLPFDGDMEKFLAGVEEELRGESPCP